MTLHHGRAARAKTKTFIIQDYESREFYMRKKDNKTRNIQLEGWFKKPALHARCSLISLRRAFKKFDS